MKTWFITGTSRGFGRVWTEAALARGDKVAATARKVESLDDLKDKYPSTLLAIKLDVTDKHAVDAAVNQAYEAFGNLDVVINNAGYGLFGSIEEVSENQARDQIETNLFGALWVTKAALPYMRKQGSGHIIQVSSIGGIIGFPLLGMYHASKWGLEGFTQSLAAEVKDFGIKVTLIEPGGFSTDWSGDSSIQAKHINVYQPLRDERDKMISSSVGSPGDPTATGKVVLKLVDMNEPPLRILFGSGRLGMITDEYKQRLDNWDRWYHLSEEAQG